MFSKAMSQFCVVVLSLSLSGAPAAASDRVAAIRAALKGPVLTLGFHFTFNYNVIDGFVTHWQDPTAAERRDAAKQRIHAGRGDAATFYDLAAACGDLGDKAAASGYYERAAALFKRQMNGVPTDRSALAGYAKALAAVKKQDQAITTLRRGLARDPGNWQAWIVLGDALTGEATDLILGTAAGQISPISFGGASNTQRFWSFILNQMKKQAPSKAEIAKAEADEREGEAAYDRAVAVAPEEPWPLFTRGMVNAYMRPRRTEILRIARGASPPPPTNVFNMPALGQELQAAARLEPDNYQLQTTAVICTELSAVADARSSHSDKFPSTDQSEITVDMDRIRKVADGRSGIPASDAFLCLAVIQLAVQQNISAAAQSAKEALEREPANDLAFEFVVASMGDAKQFAPIRDFCKQEIKLHDSALRRVILARTETHLNDNAAAEQDVRAAVRLSPQDFDADLSLAALLLKDHTDPASISEAGRFLAAAKESLGTDHKSDQWAAYALVDAAYLGITGHPDAARPLLNDEVKMAPDDDEKAEAKALLTALGP